MKIVIATGIYPPEVGGPALYAQGVKEFLERSGNEAPAILFASFRKFPSGVRHCLYAYELWRAARGARAIFAFDTLSVGIPSVLVGLLRGIPVVIRIGGDFVWETYLERTRDLVILPEFYRAPRPLSFKERVAKYLVTWMLRHARLAFNTQWLLDIWREPYAIDPTRAHIVENAIGPMIEGSVTENRRVLFYGRPIVFKNHEGFRSAFAKARAQGVDLELLEGTLPRKELMEALKHAYAIAIPSVSEVAPNYLIDALRCGKPFILTKYSGYAERYADRGVIIDPLSEDDMIRGIKELADPVMYARLCEHAKVMPPVRSYDDVAREMLAILDN
jgi:glycosyltransferase involved in cell wall biosynthesis